MGLKQNKFKVTKFKVLILGFNFKRLTKTVLNVCYFNSSFLYKYKKALHRALSHVHVDTYNLVLLKSKYKVYEVIKFK